MPGSDGRLSRRRLPVALQLAQQRADLGRLEGLASLAGIVEEAAAGLRAELVVRHLLLDELRGLEALVAERFTHVPAGAIEDVHATPVDEFEDADRGVAKTHPRAERAVDVLGRRHTLFDEPYRLVHQ